MNNINLDTIKLHENSQGNLKAAKNNNRCPIQNVFKDRYMDKETSKMKEKKS